MAKNLMPIIARELGLEIGENFKIEHNDKEHICVLTKKGLYHYAGKHRWRSDIILKKIIFGEFEVIKLPWHPKFLDKYFYPNYNFKYVWCSVWRSTPCDFALKEAGMIFRTQEECEAALPALRKKYLGEDGEEK